MTFLDSLSPASRHELTSLIDTRIAEALRRHRPERRWVSVREAAKILGISERAVRGRIERGRISVQHQGRSVLVDLASLDRQSEAG